ISTVESGISTVESGTTVVEFSTTVVKFSTSVLLMRINRNQSRRRLFTSSPSVVRIRKGKFIFAIASNSIRSNLNAQNRLFLLHFRTSVSSTIVLYCMAWKTWVISEDWKKLIWISEAVIAKD
ncbi:hypothetical protein MTR67_052906, partial [Solanum verrucosum]